MIYPKRQLILTAAAAILAGCVLHFLYEWQPSAITALFSPVNESLWEHVKLVFWPFLGAALLLNRDRPGGARPWLLVLPGLCALTLILGWVYHVALGGEALWVDIAIYVLVMLLGFWLATRFSGPFKGGKWVLPIVAVIALALLIGWFTLYPPEGLLFRDLAAVGSWLPLPCSGLFETCQHAQTPALFPPLGTFPFFKQRLKFCGLKVSLLLFPLIQSSCRKGEPAWWFTARAV